MTLARVRRPTCAARPAAWKASPSTYTPPWKYRTVWRGSTPSTVISAAGTPPSAAAVTVTPAGSGCADTSSRSSRRCSLTSMPAGKADCRRIASRVSRCSVLTEELPSVGVSVAAPPGGLSHVNPLMKFPDGEAGHCQACRQAGEEASPDHGDARDRTWGTEGLDGPDPGARGLEQEQGVPRASGSGSRALVMGTAPSRASDRVRAKLPAIKVSGCHLVPVICGPAFLTRDG